MTQGDKAGQQFDIARDSGIAPSGHERSQDDPKGTDRLPLVYRSVYSVGSKRPATSKGPGWGGLLMEPGEAAAYVGISAPELLDLHDRGVVAGVLVGERLFFRRGDLAQVPRRLAAKVKRKRS